ncbi:putative mediator of rna polymerase ii transcription subunit 6 protein [Eutypa lata UCREL1]|uniref:Mediator of RNA polymerase II transcription subunit 6 n=1 Tax=Eutypa lata (strain UCR-EL1) TaxID=1287681 RepID=M7TUE6_EUTLA|nr:putative mediator of rna polymerase ii transcription subunit 6 protein [Eutypa lata UCREL1]
MAAPGGSGSSSSKDKEPLDEIQWRSSQSVAMMGGLHSNTILMYFAESPFFDPTSNNAVLASQAMHNINMFHIIQTREAFENRLRTMSGLEFLVAQEPAEMAPGTGTGVWVIHKQTRRKRAAGAEDDITIHAAYYVVGENIYKAPTLGDILSFRMAAITSGLNRCFPAADAARTWSPSMGHSYNLTLPPTANPRGRALESRGATPLPDSQQQQASNGNKTQDSKKTTTTTTPLDGRLVERSFAIHMQFGGEYMDENPITGKPGEFHLSSTGRKPEVGRLRIPPAGAASSSSARSFGGGAGADAKVKDEKNGGGGGTGTPKTPKTPTGGLPSKPRRRKSKQGSNTPTSS